ncbi:hypothetical protein ACIBCT_39895, partial [Streptosporangium sp. NPDC050855]|uniref:hypothetical protein n=1 Tax=Streptosporangium sp. NPDC050855 TaxID=3366194 RepID=UPI0037B010BA
LPQPHRLRAADHRWGAARRITTGVHTSGRAPENEAAEAGCVRIRLAAATPMPVTTVLIRFFIIIPLAIERITMPIAADL